MDEDDDLLAYAERIATANRRLTEENQRLREELETLRGAVRAFMDRAPLDEDGRFKNPRLEPLYRALIGGDGG